MVEKVAPRRVLPWKPLLAAALAVVALVLLTRALPVHELLADFQARVKSLGVSGYVLYALVYALCCVLFVPASILTLGAGALFGVPAGTAVVLCGASLGATLSFLLARTALRRRIEGMTARSARFAALDRAIGKEGARIVLLVRLAPVFPFTYVNYAFGLTAVRPLAYVLATVVGMIPGTLAYVWLGAAAAGAVRGDAGHARAALEVAGAVFALAAAVVVARIAARAIREAGVDEDAAPPA